VPRRGRARPFVVAFHTLALLVVCASAAAERVPENASPNAYGTGWSCDRGYRRVGDSCRSIQIPENASLNIFGNGWNCDKGYRRQGDGCVTVQIPENASLDISGNGWNCNRGYVKREASCVHISRATKSEIRRLIVSESIARYPGNCPCPYFSDSAGRRCGGRSAYSRAGGHSPICYTRQVSDQQVRAYRNRYTE